MMRQLVVMAGLMTLAAATAPAGEETGQKLAVFTVSSGEKTRENTPVSVELPEVLNVWRQMRLEEIRDGKRIPVAAQVEPGKPARLWWVLEGRTPEGSTRKYELTRGQPLQEDGIKLCLTSTALNVSFRTQRMFTYHHAHVIPPEGIKPAFIRSGYIHPLFSPSGKLITEDFPGDHHHHKGIWMPWTKTTFEGRDIDFWNLGGQKGTVQFAGFQSVESGPVYGRFKARHEFVDITQPDGGKVALNEVWDVRIWGVGGPDAGYWVFDLTSTQKCASESELFLEKYRYGGLGFRGAREWTGDDYVLLTSEGKTRKDGHTTRAKWCANSGPIDGKWSTVVVMCHPKNERFPESMRIWPSGGCFFSYSPVQLGEWTFKPGETHVFRYRFFVHEGRIDKEKAEGAWLDFAHPPDVRCETF